MEEARRRARILCVDDEPNVLEGLSLHLRRRYDVVTATNAMGALVILKRDPGIAVVISDMRMAGMDGATCLRRAHEIVPDTVRILLTGQADLESAISAVNDGKIFRFLTKPCPPKMLLGAVDAAVDQHRLLTSERVLLEQTLHGCIGALTDVLALTNPVAFGRATRIKHRCTDLAARIGLPERWQVEMAAMLSQLGFITLPAETAEKVYYAQPLSEAEQQMVAAVPGVTERLLASIPRLEAIRDILATYPKPHQPVPPGLDPREQLVIRSAHVLRAAVDFDTLEAQGRSAEEALTELRGRVGQYEPSVIEALAQASSAPEQIRPVPLSALEIGMVIAADVKVISSGLLLATRGYEVTENFVQRARNFSRGSVTDPVLVFAK